jgi:hypothetical protein
MTEFATEVRHYCRNPKCHSKLPKPVSNEREAFCARGCHTAFYRKRCLVCEGPIERTRDDQKICRKAKCRSAWRARTGFGRYIAPPDAKLPSKKPVNKGPKAHPNAILARFLGGSSPNRPKASAPTPITAPLCPMAPTASGKPASTSASKSRTARPSRPPVKLRSRPMATSPIQTGARSCRQMA